MKYHLNGFDDNNNTLITKFFDTKEEAIKEFYTYVIGDYYNIETVFGTQKDKGQLIELKVDLIEGDLDNWLEWKITNIINHSLTNNF